MGDDAKRWTDDEVRVDVVKDDEEKPEEEKPEEEKSEDDRVAREKSDAEKFLADRVAREMRAMAPAAQRERERVAHLEAQGKSQRKLTMEERVEQLEEKAGLSPIVED